MRILRLVTLETVLVKDHEWFEVFVTYRGPCFLVGLGTQGIEGILTMRREFVQRTLFKVTCQVEIYFFSMMRMEMYSEYHKL